MNCPQCGVPNGVENEFCSACGGFLRATGGPLAVKAPVRQFRDPKRLTQWLRWLLIALVVASLVSGVSDLAQLQLLHAMRDGSFPSEAEMMAAAQANDARQNLIRLATIAVLLGTMLMFAIWTYRMDSNVHALGAANLRFTPGWAVGWNFVPVANLWKPYQAMSEIWRASKNPAGWQSEPASGLLGWWWFWWMVSTISGNIVVRVGERAEGMDELIAVTLVTVISLLLGVVSAVFALRLVTQVQSFQAQAADRSLSSVFA